MNVERLLENDRRQFRDVVQHKFYSDIAAGHLPHSLLALYLAQDNIYLHVFASVLNRLVRQADHRRAAEILRKHRRDALDQIKQQQGFVAGVLKLPSTLEEQSRPTTYAYCNHLKASLAEGFVEGLTSLLPCYFVYQDAVRHLRRHGSGEPVFASWIASLPSDEANALWAKEIGGVFETAAKARRGNRLRDIFSRSSSYELLFLDMVIKNEQWPLEGGTTE
jgi:thiaminase